MQNKKCKKSQKTSLNRKMICHCDGFGLDRVNFLHSRWYGAMFYAENRVDNTRSVLRMSSANTEARSFHSISEEGRGAQGAGRGNSQDS